MWFPAGLPGMRALFVTILLLLAGCAEAPEPESEPALEPEPQPLMSAPVNESIELPEVELLTGLNEFHWATSDSMDSMVVRMRVDLGDDNECKIGAGRAGTSVDGPSHIFLREGESSYGWSGSGGGDSFHVAAGPVDTRTESSGGHSAGTSISWGPMSGPVTLTLGARELSAWDSSLMDATAAISIECSRPFDLVDAHQGFEFVAWDEYNMKGTMSAHTPRGGAAYQAVGAADLTGEYNRIITRGFGLQAGEVLIRSPSDQESASIGTPLSLEGGPGNYGFEADRVGDGVFTIAAYSLHEPLDLSIGMQDQSAMPRFDEV